MAKDKQEEGAKKPTYVVVGGVWAHHKHGSGTQFLKIQVLLNNQQATLTAWPNQRKNHPQAPDFLVYAQELPE